MSDETAVGVFASREQATAAIALLQAHGFALEQVSLVMPDTTLAQAGAADEVATGAVVGGVLGGLGGLLLSAGLLTIPVVGPVLAAGPLLAALGGAAVGAGTGGIVAALRSAGLTEAQARHLERQVQAGNVLVTVATTDRHEEARALLRQAGATETDFSLAGDEK
ncbi:MAG TPA: low temperature-induced protein [Chloroflexia bacterium]|nr:low temperature-induced protein [Chloroflexia bacterium]